ncbi:hypothetical protein [Novosphingobium sp. EMRT-2]|uniref:hypothetical protein n=1 Tax=Novosphingobium sp. EMRT-2 TaxID=2571749 RepID=UPI0010BD3013|nr:hypothetical protein [Novosphingobium sp. EMRT-2]QCI93383.1 hypothetical protein FA702_07325 [Novosphingobium sp. EMRT-2]
MTETPLEAALAKHLRELTKVIVSHLGGGSEWFIRIGDDYYADPKAVGPELQRRKTDAQVAKKALIRANREATPLPTTANNPETDAHRDLVEALKGIVDAEIAAGIADVFCDYCDADMRENSAAEHERNCPLGRAIAALTKAEVTHG